MRLIIMPFFLFTLVQCNGQEGDRFLDQRNSMVQHQIVDRGINGQELVNAFLKVPRHRFVPAEYQNEAYDDHPLPIGFDQTISQPYVVAYMTDLVGASKGKRGLEIGTGSGYQAAILAELIDSVYTIEIVPELAKRSALLLSELGYNNILVKQGDGYKGWPEHAPFDLIIVTAACDQIPQPLVDQLAEGGKLIMPLGEPNSVQQLVLIERNYGKIQKKKLSYVRFVPLIRERN